MKYYRRSHNSGPVPYPDGSGRLLKDEVVSGEYWAGLVDIGYVVEFDVPVAVEAPAVAVVAPDVAPAPVEAAPKHEAPVAAVEVPVDLGMAPTQEAEAEEAEEVNDAGITNERTGTEEMDSPPAGSTDSEGGSVRGTARRRNRRS